MRVFPGTKVAYPQLVDLPVGLAEAAPRVLFLHGRAKVFFSLEAEISVVSKVLRAGPVEFVPIAVQVFAECSSDGRWNWLAKLVLHIKTNDWSFGVQVLGLGLVFDCLPRSLISPLEEFLVVFFSWFRRDGSWCRRGFDWAGSTSHITVDEDLDILSCQLNVPVDGLK